MPLEDNEYIPIKIEGGEYIVKRESLKYLGIGQHAHECREQAQAEQIGLLTHLLVEARMLIEQQSKYIIDQERRMREMGKDNG